jgi:Fe-S oxidoreductase
MVMGQQQLRELEARCVQEQPAWCLAACPLHVDARTFLGQAATGDWRGARKTLERSMPFPGILGRICEAPCQDRCKRGEVDDPLAIGAVERVCVSRVGQVTKPLPLPAKKTRILILGAGLAGMVAALELARKGYAVELRAIADQLGGTLRTLPDSLLPKQELETAAAELARFQILVVTGQNADGWALAALRERYDALFLDRDEPAAAALCGPATPDPITLALGEEQAGVFVGGGLGKDGKYRAVDQAADGRRAVSSIDRFLQKVSMTAQRDKEGPYETSLFSSVSGVARQERTRMADPETGYSEEEAKAEAGRCLQCECLECVKACVFLQHYKGYPKSLTRQIYNNESIVKGTHLANKLINSCSLCGQCSVICPQGFPMAEVCLAARERMVRSEKMPPSAHEFALDDLAFTLSERFSLARHAPGQSESEFCWFPGCQLAGSRPNQVARVYDWLRSIHPKTGLILGCCGAPALWAGSRDLYATTLRVLRAQLASLGNPRLVLACAACYDLFAKHAPDIKLVAFSELMVESPPPANNFGAGKTLAIHDPCPTRAYPSNRQRIRALAKLAGVTVEELPRTGALTSCCGYGGLQSSVNPALARATAMARGEQSASDYLVYCAMCRDNFARIGKRVYHVMDLFFAPTTGPYAGKDPAERKGPGFSERRDNRERLKRELLQTLWGESSMDTAPHRTITLVYSPEVRALLDERRILDEDAQRVIHYAETTGNRFFDPNTKHCLAYHAPARVTYWVEYEPEGAGFRVHNAYSHRMRAPGSGQ